MNVRSPRFLDVLRCLEKDIQPFLNTHGPDIANQVILAVFQGCVWGHTFEGLKIRTVTHDENISGIEPASRDGNIFVTVVSGYDHVASSEGHLFKPKENLVKRSLLFIFCHEEFGICVVKIEYVFDSQQFEWERDQKNVVGRIARLNNLESMPQIDPPGIEKFPKQCAAVFPSVSERAVSLFG